jgi:DNA-binding HxlR family transcriptional regulator
VIEPTAGPVSAGVPPPVAGCCPQYHEAIELIGRRWTGAIIAVLLRFEPLRFSDIAARIPDISDRLLSERVKELEQRGLVERRVEDGPPVRVRYALTPMGRGLAPAVGELHAWAQRWLPGTDIAP